MNCEDNLPWNPLALEDVRRKEFKEKSLLKYLSREARNSVYWEIALRGPWALFEDLERDSWPLRSAKLNLRVCQESGNRKAQERPIRNFIPVIQLSFWKLVLVKTNMKWRSLEALGSAGCCPAKWWTWGATAGLLPHSRRPSKPWFWSELAGISQRNQFCQWKHGNHRIAYDTRWYCNQMIYIYIYLYRFRWLVLTIK